MHRLLACLLLVGLAGPAAACINDLELPAHEREFRSDYRGPASPPPVPSTDASSPSGNLLLTAMGTALLAGAIVVGWTGGKRKG